MAGLGPAIHDLGKTRLTQQVVDPRAKPGDDGPMAAPINPESPYGSDLQDEGRLGWGRYLGAIGEAGLSPP
jgi:hypothetical protein